MSEMTRQTSKLVPELPIPLETAQLILVHDDPLAIRFRADEKKFDVDGAYNIRYEIVKKRIDKAYIKNSEERLTQPGKIAIVYAPKKRFPLMKYLIGTLFRQLSELLLSSEYLSAYPSTGRIPFALETVHPWKKSERIFSCVSDSLLCNRINVQFINEPF